MSEIIEETRSSEERFEAVLHRAIERAVARAERILAGPAIDPTEVVQVAGQLILLERTMLGVFAPLDLYREFFPPAV